MQELHNSVMGRRLIEHHIPEIHVQLKRIADALEVLSKRELVKIQKKEKASSGLNLIKVKPGQYQATFNDDNWHIYRDGVSYKYWWFAENLSKPHEKAFRADTKNDVLNLLKASYAEKEVKI